MVLNINVGILGHVDSGKTTLSKALSTVASTAAFDKNPQSQKRGITLDLGFSSFKVNENIPSQLLPSDTVQITLVDCPGHASLIRTIICGAHVIDLMLLIVDANKGFQTQTAECLIIGELTCEALVVVLNKIDLLPPEKREERIAKMKSRIAKTLEATRFKNASIVAVSALPTEQSPSGEGMEDLISALLSSIPDPRPKRSQLASQSFLFAVDHCFSKSGQGTVLTGTVLNGCIRVGETIEVPQHKLKKKIKSIQMFRNPVDKIGPGDRAGICVTQLDPSVMERGFLALPDSLLICQTCLLTDVKRIYYFKGSVSSKQCFHVSIGQDTLLARITCLRRVNKTTKNGDEEFEYDNNCVILHFSIFNISHNILLLNYKGGQSCNEMLLEFGVFSTSAVVVAPLGSLVIGARLDTDPNSPACRLAFHGRVGRTFASPEEYRSLPVYRHKARRGEVERVVDARTCIVRGLFKRETNWDIFTGLSVTLSNDSPVCGGADPLSIRGIVEGSFGQSGKCRVRLNGKSDLGFCIS
ncbi:unnamed protein product [Rodentolepis nana]|uniref:Selenocysteine-specific elongation factor n=1 Tax=Rodentolepis nana TaxID=102285 RepID=A0A0R3T9L9_RODNA|nr:unnamed protein product [Rodentolepis nana]